MKRFIGLLGMVLCLAHGHAQNINSKQAKKQLEEFRKSIHAEFEDFRNQCMKEFADFVSDPWKEFEETPPVPMPKEKPAPPVVLLEEDKDKTIESKPIVIKDVIKPVPVTPQPAPIEPIKEVPIAEDKYINFTFYGTAAKVRFDVSKKPNLRSVDENIVADALKNIKSGDYDNMLVDCLQLRKTLYLSDWAYLQMLRKLSAEIAGNSHNDSALLLAYLYMQSGYKMRLASDGQRIYMLYASKHQIYNQASYTVDNEQYYGVEKLPSRLFICEASFPKEKALSLMITTQQCFEYVESPQRTIFSKKYPDFKATVSVNKNLIDFYNGYPSSMFGGNFMTRWAMYANTPIESNIQKTLYSQLKEKLKSLSQMEAVGRLLNLVQTGFDYEYDEKVWGEDRAFFSEETFYYPYCDCEDRSILLTRLVRDLLGLKCILVYYPGHLASAIEFTAENVQGDYVELNGHKYVIADGTYINAPIGKTMPGMDNSSAKVILLD